MNNDKTTDKIVRDLAAGALYFHLREESDKITLWNQCERQADRSYCVIEDGKTYTYGELRNFRYELIVHIYQLAMFDNDVKEKAHADYEEYKHIK